MDKKLFEVEITVLAYAVGKDQEEAKEALRRADLYDLADLTNISMTLQEARYVDADWEDSIPYGDDENMTCKQYLEAGKPEETEESFMRKTGQPELPMKLD